MLCNAGKVRDAVKHVLEADVEFFDGVIAANLRGHYLCSVAAAHHMARNGGGVIITTSSGGATRAHRGMTAYDASKGGIEALTRALALDLAPYGIRVVGLVPGLIAPDDAPQEALARTGATVPLQRAGTSEDIAGPAVFLASDDAAYVTGQLRHGRRRRALPAALAGDRDVPGRELPDRLKRRRAAAARRPRPPASDPCLRRGGREREHQGLAVAAGDQRLGSRRSCCLKSIVSGWALNGAGNDSSRSARAVLGHRRERRVRVGRVAAADLDRLRPGRARR